jgi:hypothetical protein
MRVGAALYIDCHSRRERGGLWRGIAAAFGQRENKTAGPIFSPTRNRTKNRAKSAFARSGQAIPSTLGRFGMQVFASGDYLFGGRPFSGLSFFRSVKSTSPCCSNGTPGGVSCGGIGGLAPWGQLPPDMAAASTPAELDRWYTSCQGANQPKGTSVRLIR